MSVWHDPKGRLVVDWNGHGKRRLSVDYRGLVSGNYHVPSTFYAVMVDETVERSTCEQCGGDAVTLISSDRRAAPHSCRRAIQMLGRVG